MDWTAERLIVTSRIKDCESAIEVLRRRQEGATFDTDRPGLYSLDNLSDLAGVRVVAFPRSRLSEIDYEPRKRFPSWVSDPVPGFAAKNEPLAFKYHGKFRTSDKVEGEFQVMPMLTALFWEVEHSAIYKPSPRLKGVVRSLTMQERSKEVLASLKASSRSLKT